MIERLRHSTREQWSKRAIRCWIAEETVLRSAVIQCADMLGRWKTYDDKPGELARITLQLAPNVARVERDCYDALVRIPLSKLPRNDNVALVACRTYYWSSE